MATAYVTASHVEDKVGDDGAYKNDEEFTIVKRKRKASAVENMEQEESSEAKRPNFPPLSGHAITSVSYYQLISCTEWNITLRQPLQ